MGQKKLVSYSNEIYGAIKCPACNCDHSHQSTVDVFERSEDDPSGNHIKINGNDIEVDRDLTGNPSARRRGLTISLECENKHKFKLHVYQHKGQTYLETEN